MSYKKHLLDRIANREARLSVIGLGYVGLPLVVEFARVGFTVTALDIDSAKIAKLQQGISYIDDVSSEELQSLVAAGKIIPTDTYDALREVDAISICVQTPLTETQDPDLSSVNSVLASLQPVLRDGMLVVLESTTYPGTTAEVVRPQVESNGRIAGETIFIAFSGERIDPGNKTYQLHNTPKVVGGITAHGADLAVALYGTIIEQVVPVSSTTAAEMVKLLENTFRSVNIGLANEMAIICQMLGLDVWEVIQAAATKPFGFMPFYPGPGVGGHCIPIDPLYLSWKMKTLEYQTRFIDIAQDVNRGMPRHVVNLIADALNDEAKPLRGSHIMVLGVAYKPNIDDVRESPALHVMELLRAKGAQVAYHDPYVPQVRLGEDILQNCDYSAELLNKADCVVILTNHAVFDWAHIAAESRLIVDTRNAIKGYPSQAKVISL